MCSDTPQVKGMKQTLRDSLAGKTILEMINLKIEGIKDEKCWDESGSVISTTNLQ